MTVRGKPPGHPPDDDDPYLEWSGPNGVDTEVQLTPADLEAFEAEEVTPTRGPESLPGYELGRRDERRAFFNAWEFLLAQQRTRGAAEVLAVLRARLIKAGDTPEEAAHSASVIARLAGFRTY